MRRWGWFELRCRMPYVKGPILINYTNNLTRNLSHLGLFALLLFTFASCRPCASTNHDYQPEQFAGCWQSDIAETEWGPMYHEIYFDSAGAFIHYLYGKELASWTLISERKGHADIDTSRLVYLSQRTGIEETFYRVQGRSNLELRYRNYQDDRNEITQLTRCPKGR
jgi:hypothetical protein